MPVMFPKEFVSSAGRCTGAAWLSSARVVRCSVKSGDERTLVPSCQRVMPGTLGRQTSCRGGKVGTASSQYGPYDRGCTRATMPSTMGCNAARLSKSTKLGPVRIGVCNSTPKLESLVMAYQQRRREYSRPCTHRPSHHESRFCPKYVS